MKIKVTFAYWDTWDHDDTWFLSFETIMEKLESVSVNGLMAYAMAVNGPNKKEYVVFSSVRLKQGQAQAIFNQNAFNAAAEGKYHEFDNVVEVDVSEPATTTPIEAPKPA